MHQTPHTLFSIAKEKLWKGMPFRERRVLMAVVAHGPDSLFKVTDLINFSALGSPATVHKALNNLIESGHLKHSITADFGRSKFITLSKSSNALFIKLDALFIACATKRNPRDAGK